jgi:hypothetical protein
VNKKMFFRKVEKSCKNCHYYDEYKTSDKLNPDKTITYGKVEVTVCGKERDPFELKDFTPCLYWKQDEHNVYNRKNYAFIYILKKDLERIANKNA